MAGVGIQDAENVVRLLGSLSLDARQTPQNKQVALNRAWRLEVTSSLGKTGCVVSLHEYK
jgi:hypothetical protein